MVESKRAELTSKAVGSERRIRIFVSIAQQVADELDHLADEKGYGIGERASEAIYKLLGKFREAKNALGNLNG